MKYQLRIDLSLAQLPMNTGATRGNPYALGRKAKAIQDTVGWLAREKGLPPEPLEKATIICVRKSTTPCDYDNLVASFKAAIDGLVKVGVIVDDRMSVLRRNYEWMKASRANQGCVMVLEEATMMDHNDPAERRCSTCRHWDHTNDDLGLCNRHAPSPYLVPEERDEEGSIIDPIRVAFWPETQSHATCGEWENGT